MAVLDDFHDGASRHPVGSMDAQAGFPHGIRGLLQRTENHAAPEVRVDVQIVKVGRNRNDVRPQRFGQPADELRPGGFGVATRFRLVEDDRLGRGGDVGVSRIGERSVVMRWEVGNIGGLTSAAAGTTSLLMSCAIRSQASSARSATSTWG